MADIDLVGASPTEESGQGLRSVSKLTAEECLRNFVDPCAPDGSRMSGALTLLECIAANTAHPGTIPTEVSIYASATADTNYPLIRCPGAGSRIVITDISVSFLLAATITFMDQNGRAMLAPFYGGVTTAFSRNYTRGLWLPLGSNLNYTCSGAVGHSVEISHYIA